MEMISLSELILRIFIACVIGSIFGIERKNKGKPAGITTNMIVCAGAAVVAILQIIIPNASGATNSDSTRMIAQVISGLGFLGAGAIMRDEDRIKGMTTAATLWIVAILGVSIGMGFYKFTILATALILLLLIIVKKMEVIFIEKRKIKKILLHYEYGKEFESEMRRFFDEKNIKVISQKTLDETDDGENHKVKKVLQISIPRYLSSNQTLKYLRKYEDVLKVIKLK